MTSRFSLHTRLQHSILLPLRTQAECQLTGTILSRYWGWNNMSHVSKMRYIAHALDFQDVIESHAVAEADSTGAASLVAVFEDDIVLTTSPVQAHKRLVVGIACPTSLASPKFSKIKFQKITPNFPPPKSRLPYLLQKITPASLTFRPKLSARKTQDSHSSQK